MKLKRNAIAALAVVAAVAVGGSSSALAQGSGQGSDRGRGDGQRCEKLIERIAQRMGVSTDQAKAALKARIFARIDEAVKNGRMSQERAAALKAKIDADLCAALGGMAQRKMEQRAALGMLRAAGAYLELSKAELRAQLPGTSLAALAVKQGQGKTAAGLKAAMVAPGKAKLDKALADGKIDATRHAAALEKLTKLADRLAEKVWPKEA